MPKARETFSTSRGTLWMVTAWIITSWNSASLCMGKVWQGYGNFSCVCPVLSSVGQAKSNAIYTIFLIFCYFFAHFKKKLYLCSAISPRLGIMSFGWGGCRHNKASISALCLATWNFATFNYNSNTSQHFDVLGICISISIRTIGVCMRAYISAWASVLLVRV